MSSRDETESYLRKVFSSSKTYRSAYLNVFRVCSHDPSFGEMQEIITVLEFPTNESRSTSVSLLPRNGICSWSLSSARIHSLRAKRLLLISAPSILRNNHSQKEQFRSRVVILTVEGRFTLSMRPNNHFKPKFYIDGEVNTLLTDDKDDLTLSGGHCLWCLHLFHCQQDQ